MSVNIIYRKKSFPPVRSERNRIGGIILQAVCKNDKGYRKLLTVDCIFDHAYILLILFELVYE